MMKKAFVVAISLGAVLVASAYMLYIGNAAPAVSEISAEEAANPSKPYVVKLHAQWCPVCMMTKGVWSQIEATYSPRVNLVVFDFTNESTSGESRDTARRLGLEQFFDENTGWTGTIAVLDGRTKEVAAVIHGSRDFAEYRAAIDRTLKGETK